MFSDVLRSVDKFHFEPPSETRKTTFVSGCGTIVAVVAALAASIQQLVLFSKHTSVTGRTPLPREPDVRVASPGFGFVLFANGDPFFNESYFRWQFRYRGIFYGDLDNDKYPRQYYSLPAATCKVYFDVEKGLADPAPRFLGAETGKVAEMGCPDPEATKAILQSGISSGAKSLSLDMPLQGRYSEATYWFMEVKLMPCAAYGPDEGIECANESDVHDLLAGAAVDLALLDGMSPGVWKWSNHYFNIDPRSWTGHELFFKPILFKEHDKTLPSLNEPVESTHLTWDSVTFRRTPRDPADTLVSLYFRLSSTVDEVEVTYFTLESAFEGIGAWHGFIFLCVGVICLNFNRVVHRIESRKKTSSDSVDAAEPEAREASTLQQAL